MLIVPAAAELTIRETAHSGGAIPKLSSQRPLGIARSPARHIAPLNEPFRAERDALIGVQMLYFPSISAFRGVAVSR